MKKFLFITLAAALLLSLGACNRRNADEAQVRVTVKNAAGIPQKNARVHMYADLKPNRNTAASDSRMNRETDNYGVATFDIKLRDNNITAGQTSVYFAVFYEVDGQTYVTTHNGVMLKGGDMKDITIKLPVQ